LDGCEWWFVNGRPHKIGAPAVKLTHGEWWYEDGLLHRTNGPAVVHVDNKGEARLKEWRHYGVLHREDGPAIERSNGHNEWWLNGAQQRVEGVCKCDLSLFEKQNTGSKPSP
jgi:hypothetical protein